MSASAPSSRPSRSPARASRPSGSRSISAPRSASRRARRRSPCTTEPEALVGRQVAAVVNFPPRQIGKMMSEVLTLGFPDASGEVVLIMPERAGAERRPAVLKACYSGTRMVARRPPIELTRPGRCRRRGCGRCRGRWPARGRCCPCPGCARCRAGRTAGRRCRARPAGMPGPSSSTSMRSQFLVRAGADDDVVAEAGGVGDEIGDGALEGLPLQRQHELALGLAHADLDRRAEVLASPPAPPPAARRRWSAPPPRRRRPWRRRDSPRACAASR